MKYEQFIKTSIGNGKKGREEHVFEVWCRTHEENIEAGDAGKKEKTRIE